MIVWNLIGAPRAGVVLQAGSRWVQDGPCVLGAHDRSEWSPSSIFRCQCSKLTPLHVARSQSTRSGTPRGAPTGHSQSPHHQSTRVHCCACLPAALNSDPLHLHTLQFITVMVFQNSTWILNSVSLAIETGFLCTHSYHRTHARTHACTH